MELSSFLLSVYPTGYCMSIPMALVLLMGIVKTGVKFIWGLILLVIGWTPSSFSEVLWVQSTCITHTGFWTLRHNKRQGLFVCVCFVEWPWYRLVPPPPWLGVAKLRDNCLPACWQNPTCRKSHVLSGEITGTICSGPKAWDFFFFFSEQVQMCLFASPGEIEIPNPSSFSHNSLSSLGFGT